ncbi:uncharacterized protein LOC143911623 [Arctopsyche grandis]|uniref:uncharacterized protein LOC143911623 n=1 Tax=Arctopsyche grandis TaxID=121162 RepID=UPI00406D8097
MEGSVPVSRPIGLLRTGSDGIDSSILTLTPGRTRNIAQDMEALRLSRQDNPFLQQVMASRESLIDNTLDECESDDAVLMSQEFCNASIDLLAEDPVTLKEIHDHMIRSPPPISFWPQDNLSPRASSAFDFTGNSTHSISYSALSINNSDHSKDFMGASILRKSPLRVTAKLHNTSEDLRNDFKVNSRNNSNPLRTRSSSRPISPKNKDFNSSRPLSLPGESHLKNALGKSRQSSQHDRFSILHHPVPLRMSTSSKGSFSDDSVQLVQDCDK